MMKTCKHSLSFIMYYDIELYQLIEHEYYFSERHKKLQSVEYASKIGEVTLQ